MKAMASVLQQPFFNYPIKVPTEVLSMIKTVGEKHGIPVTHEFAVTIHRLYVYSIAQTLREKGKVILPQIGMFKMKNYKPRRAFSVHTKSMQDLPGRKVVAFRQSHTLSKEKVNSWKSTRITVK